MPNYNDYNEQNISQIPAIEVLKEIGYTYIYPHECDEMRGSQYNVILKDILRERLIELNKFEYKGVMRNFSMSNIEKAVEDIDEPLTSGLVSTSEKIYDMLMLGKSYVENLPDGNKQSFDIRYIDFENIENNVYHVTEEFSVKCENGKETARPDIVLFVNGIPLGVIECKRASLSMNQGMHQMIRNQKPDYIPNLFKFTQILMSTNKNETKYATCGTPDKFWSVWKEEKNKWFEEKLEKVVEGRIPTNQDKNIVSLFSPKRLLEITKYFILYDVGVKKITRYQQYFAIREILKTVEQKDEKENRQSGVIWHTQGSGKSLTMVMFTKYILGELRSLDPKVIVVTDRISLDKQIHETFNHTKLKAERARKGTHLLELIDDSSVSVVTTIVNKFDIVSNSGKKVDSKDIFVLIDESHRSQYGEMNQKMQKVFPNACYLGFTGTPLMKQEKNTMIKFGKLIHKYTIADGVNDKAILPLLYEGKMIDQTVNKVAIDNNLEIITRNLNDKQKEEVMKKWSRYEKIASSDQRIKMIAFDINEHYMNNYKTKGSQFKAMLATSSRKEAIKYYESFEELGDINTAVVMSSPDTRDDHYDIYDESKENIVQGFWKKMMLRYGNEEKYEDNIKNEFVNGDEVDMLIVVDKLLTGFDAPRATILYIDKEMKEHTLLQAIARVNRLYEGKDYGIIIDYRGLLEKLDEAMNMYSGSGLENFEPEDLKGSIYDVISIIGTLRHHYTELVNIFACVKNKSDTEEYEVILADDDTRNTFYDELSQFARNLCIALQSEQIYRAIGESELAKYKREVKFYQELRISVKRRYSDTIDHKEYEEKMQKLMDNYIMANEIIRVTNPINILDEEGFKKELSRMGTDRSKADTIRTRLSKGISQKHDENPAYYDKFSYRIEKVLEEYRQKRIDEAQYLSKMEDIMNDFRKGVNDLYEYPDELNENKNAQAFYGVIKDITTEVRESEFSDKVLAELSLEIEKTIKKYAKVDWHSNIEVHKRIEQEIDELIWDYKNKYNYVLDYEDIDKIINSIKVVALRRF